MNLIIDQGNTNLKLALFKGGQILRKQSFREFKPQDIHQFLQAELPERAIVATVVHDEFTQLLQEEVHFPVYKLSMDKPLPFALDYNTPETLGYDRIALAAAAVSHYPGQNCLVIDAGTCLTFDFVDHKGSFKGGGIAPGLQMRYKALPHYTARLPLVEHQWPQDFIGKSTRESIISGVAHGMVREVEGTIEAYRQRFPGVICVITGGDAILFEGLLKNGIFAAPEFLLHGLNNILEHYAEVL